MRMKFSSSLLAIACLAVVSPASAVVRETHYVLMRDNVTTLATEVWRADGDPVPRPTILRRTPYGRNVGSTEISLAMTLGLTLVSQDVRGRGGSGGEFTPFIDDAHDGADTAAWLAQQPFCNGSISTVGGSAEAIVQLLALGEGTPAVKSAFVLFATGDVYESFLPGGAWRGDLTTGWLESVGQSSKEHFVREHELNSSFWDPARLDSLERSRIGVPILLVGGFYDIFAKDTTKAHRLLQQQAAIGARDKQYLVMGPWTHGNHDRAKQGEVTFDNDSKYSMETDWFALLRGTLLGGPAPNFPPVRYYLMSIGDNGVSATGKWMNSEQWPPDSTETVLSIRSDGFLSKSLRPDASWATISLESDPSKPIPSVGGGNLNTAAGPFDQAKLDARENVFTATTPPMEEDVLLVGDVSARVFAASTSTDVDVVVRLSQVTPSGRVVLLTDGVRRGRFLEGQDEIRPLAPLEPHWFEVELGPIAATIPSGHAIRVAIQPSSDPRYEANPGVAAPLSSYPSPVVHSLILPKNTTEPNTITLPVTGGVITANDDDDSPCDSCDASPSTDAGDDAGGTANGAHAGDTDDAGCSCRVRSTASFSSFALPLAMLIGVSAARRARKRQD